jgi:hypothetical protein
VGDGPRQWRDIVISDDGDLDDVARVFMHAAEIDTEE